MVFLEALAVIGCIAIGAIIGTVLGEFIYDLCKNRKQARKELIEKSKK